MRNNFETNSNNDDPITEDVTASGLANGLFSPMDVFLDDINGAGGSFRSCNRFP